MRLGQMDGAVPLYQVEAVQVEAAQVEADPSFLMLKQ